METSSNSTNNKAATASPRRSGRARTSTTIEIDGHTVLKQNNYEVKGDNYVWGKEDDSEASKPLQPPKPKKIKTIHNTNEEKPRRPQDVAKSQHNATIVKATKDKQSLRNSFLAQHVVMLKHFCESSVTDKLLQHASNNKATPVAPPQVETPQMIEATLRDYQTKGLEFMVRMHRQNLSMILGDEMGLVSAVFVW